MKELSKKKSKTRRKSLIKKDCIDSEKTSVSGKRFDKKVECNNSIKNDIQSNADIVDKKYVVDKETGEVIDKIRTGESLHRSWYRQKDLVFNNASWKKSLFITATLDSKPTYDAMNKVTATFAKWLKRKYSELKCGFIFLEPCEDGSWHVHLIVALNNTPLHFEANVIKWWNKHNTKLCDKQIKIRPFSDVDDLIRTVYYLDPNCQKKRHRAKFYPVSGQPMRHFGGVEEPNRVLTDFEKIKEIVGSEKPAMRKSFEVRTDDNTLLFSIAEYYFNIELSSLLKLHFSVYFDNPEPDNIIPKNDNIVNPLFEKKIAKRKGSFNDYVYDNYTSKYG